VACPQENRHISHVVLMGMREPLYNYEKVKKALLIAMDPVKTFYYLVYLRVTPHIIHCGQELGVNLVISLYGEQ